MRSTRTGLAVFALISLAFSSAFAAPRLGLWLDENHSLNCIDTEPFQAIEIWLWVEGVDEGAEAIAFRVLYPGNVASGAVTYNPEVSLIAGSIYEGVNLAFSSGIGDCEWNTFWGFHQTVYVLNDDSGIIQLAPNIDNPRRPAPDLRAAAPCPMDFIGTPFVHADKASSVCINCCIDDFTPPVIEFVRCVSTTSIEALFSEPVAPGPAAEVARYKVYDRATAQQEIAVSSATLLPDGRTVAIDLAAPIANDTGYFLRATAVPDLIGNAWVTHGQFGNGPDLMIASFDAPDTLSDCAEGLPLTVRVANIGGMASPAFSVEYVVQHLDEGGEWTPVWDQWSPRYLCGFPEGLAAGDTASSSLTLTLPTYQGIPRHPMRFLLAADNCPDYSDWECYGGIDEAREDNNGYSVVTTVLSPAIVSARYCTSDLPPCDSTGITFARSAFDDPSIDWPVTRYDVYKRGIFGDPPSLAAIITADGSSSYSIDVPWAPDREFVYFRVVAVRPVAGGERQYRSCERMVQRAMPPTALTGVTARQAECGLLITWNPSPEPDVWRYDLFRGTSADFVPDTLNHSNGVYFCQESRSCADNGICYPNWHPGDGYYFKLAAFDTRSKYSPFTLIAPEQVIATALQRWSAVLRDFAVEIVWALFPGSTAREFVVSRAGDGGGNFAPCAGTVESRDGLEFAWIDRTAEPGRSYRYRVETIDEGERAVLFETESVAIPPRPLALMQNRPNPFNPSTTIEYYLPRPGAVRLAIYDIAGREVARPVDAAQAAGSHSIIWTGINRRGEALASGIYFYRLSFEKESITRKLVLLR